MKSPVGGKEVVVVECHVSRGIKELLAILLLDVVERLSFAEGEDSDGLIARLGREESLRAGVEGKGSGITRAGYVEVGVNPVVL